MGQQENGLCPEASIKDGERGEKNPEGPKEVPNSHDFINYHVGSEKKKKNKPRVMSGLEAGGWLLI